jgi:IS1 family transposase
MNVQIDELWLFVDDKGNHQWVWLAMDRDTREIIDCDIGDSPKATLRDRSKESAVALWQSIPAVCGLYTDNVPRSTPITGRPTSRLFRANGMLLSAKTAA